VESTKSTEWVYRASDAMEDPQHTRVLADEFGFICRSAHVDAEDARRIPYVREVDFGHLIHLYYVDADGGAAVGAYRVGLKGHPRASQFAGAVEGIPALRKVAEGELAALLRERLRYAPDPKLGVFSGWPVVRVAGSSPTYGPELFTGRNSLAPYPSRPQRRR
jgi:hypothetical protein